MITEFASDLLAKDASAAGRTGLLNELVSMESSIKRLLDKGMTPKEADRAGKIITAIQASKQIVDNIWNVQYN